MKMVKSLLLGIDPYETKETGGINCYIPMIGEETSGITGDETSG